MTKVEMSDKTKPPGNFFVNLLKDWGVALALVLLGYAMWSTLFAPQAPSLGPAADFSLENLAGETFTLSESEAEVVVVNFWFMGCPPCRREIPELAKFATENPDIAMVGVNTDQASPAQLEAFAKRFGITYEILRDNRGQVSRTYGVNVFPTTLVITDGQIVASKVGELNGMHLRAMVDQAH